MNAVSRQQRTICRLTVRPEARMLNKYNVLHQTQGIIHVNGTFVTPIQQLKIILGVWKKTNITRKNSRHKHLNIWIPLPNVANQLFETVNHFLGRPMWQIVCSGMQDNTLKIIIKKKFKNRQLSKRVTVVKEIDCTTTPVFPYFIYEMCSTCNGAFLFYVIYVI